MSHWRQKLASVQEWSAVDKGILMVGLIIPIYFQYWLWGLYVQRRPDAGLLIDLPVMQVLTTIDLTFMSGAIGLFLAGFAVRRRRPHSLLFQHVTTQYFALSLVSISYFIGSASFSVGVVLLGAPVFGFILLDRLVVWCATVAALVLMLLLTYASAFGVLPYAPLIVPPDTAASALFWQSSALGFALPFFVMIVLLSDQALLHWRQREDVIRQLSRTDVLTNVHNRRNIMDLLSREVARTVRHGPPLAVVILDLDHFKRVNDTWGHPTGDRVLQAAAKTLRDTIRQGDEVGRYGGEEFMIVLPETNLAGAAILIERCRQRLTEVEVVADNGDIVRMSGSFGVACNEELAALSAETLINAADAAMYRAKEGGRNRVESVLLQPTS